MRQRGSDTGLSGTTSCCLFFLLVMTCVPIGDDGSYDVLEVCSQHRRAVRVSSTIPGLAFQDFYQGGLGCYQVYEHEDGCDDVYEEWSTGYEYGYDQWYDAQPCRRFEVGLLRCRLDYRISPGRGALHQVFLPLPPGQNARSQAECHLDLPDGSEHPLDITSYLVQEGHGLAKNSGVNEMGWISFLLEVELRGYPRVAEIKLRLSAEDVEIWAQALGLDLEARAGDLSLVFMEQSSNQEARPSAEGFSDQPPITAEVCTNLKLAAPRRLEALPGEDRIQVRWDASFAPDGYLVRYGTKPGGPYPHELVSKGEDLVVTGLAAQTTYHFTVQARCGEVIGPATNELVSATEPMLRRGEQPQTLGLEDTSPDKVWLEYRGTLFRQVNGAWFGRESLALNQRFADRYEPTFSVLGFDPQTLLPQPSRALEAVLGWTHDYLANNSYKVLVQWLPYDSRGETSHEVLIFGNGLYPAPSAPPCRLVFTDQLVEVHLVGDLLFTTHCSIEDSSYVNYLQVFRLDLSKEACAAEAFLLRDLWGDLLIAEDRLFLFSDGSIQVFDTNEFEVHRTNHPLAVIEHPALRYGGLWFGEGTYPYQKTKMAYDDGLLFVNVHNQDESRGGEWFSNGKWEDADKYLNTLLVLKRGLDGAFHEVTTGPTPCGLLPVKWQHYLLFPCKKDELTFITVEEGDRFVERAKLRLPTSLRFLTASNDILAFLDAEGGLVLYQLQRETLQE